MVRVDGKAAAFRVERLAVERLEERCVLALPWPVDTASIVGIAATYGQFDDRTNVGGPGVSTSTRELTSLSARVRRSTPSKMARWQR
jgi:hypothetical protein